MLTIQLYMGIVAVNLILSQIGLRQHKPPRSYIPKYVSSDNAKFDYHYQLWLQNMFADSGKVALKGGFLPIIAIFRANLLPEDEIINGKQPSTGEARFSCTFQLTTCIYRNYLEKGHVHKYGDQKLISDKYDP